MPLLKSELSVEMSVFIAHVVCYDVHAQTSICLCVENKDPGSSKIHLCL